MNPLNFKYKYLLISLFFAMISGCSIYWFLEEKAHDMEKRNHVELVPRIVASRLVKMGSRLRHEDLAVRQLPAAFISQDSYSLDQLTWVTGKLLVADIRPGELITRLHLTDQEPQDLAEKIDAGHRAITIPVDQINSISGLLKPKDKIDLYVSFDHSGKRVTALLVENISVLATGQSLSGHEEFSINKNVTGFATVTLSVTAEQAVKIVAARQDGKVTAVLSGRSPLLHQVKTSNPRTGGDLAGLLGMNDEDRHDAQANVIYGDLIQQDTNNPSPVEARKLIGDFVEMP